MADVNLYSTLGCHLCEKARAMCEPLLKEYGLTLVEVEIAEDPKLLQSYGIRIPVLHHINTARELSWPFNEAQLLEWIHRCD